MAMTFGALLLPLKIDPALVVKRMLAPDAVPPDWPGFKVTVRDWGRASSVAPGGPCEAIEDWRRQCDVLRRAARGDLGLQGDRAGGGDHDRVGVQVPVRDGSSCHAPGDDQQGRAVRRKGLGR